VRDDDRAAFSDGLMTSARPVVAPAAKPTLNGPALIGPAFPDRAMLSCRVISCGRRVISSTGGAPQVGSNR
jgi:hypothetical protein